MIYPTTTEPTSDKESISSLSAFLIYYGVALRRTCSKIDADNKIKLLIVDSIIYHYRAECVGRSKLPEKIQRLNKYMHLLLQTASSNSVGVVVTNHQRSHQSTDLTTE